MKKSVGVFFILSLLVFSSVFVSAGWFSDFFGKITGNAVYDSPTSLTFPNRDITSSYTFNLGYPVKISSISFLWTDYNSNCKATLSAGGASVSYSVGSPENKNINGLGVIASSLKITISGCPKITIANLKIVGNKETIPNQTTPFQDNQIDTSITADQINFSSENNQTDTPTTSNQTTPSQDNQTYVAFISNQTLSSQNNFISSALSCQDSDGGLDYSISGETDSSFGNFDSCALVSDYDNETGEPYGWQIYDQNFSCLGEDCYLAEAYCSIQEDGLYDSDATKLVPCPNGCANGVCLDIEPAICEVYTLYPVIINGAGGLKDINDNLICLSNSSRCYVNEYLTIFTELNSEIDEGYYSINLKSNNGFSMYDELGFLLGNVINFETRLNSYIILSSCNATIFDNSDEGNNLFTFVQNFFGKITGNAVSGKSCGSQGGDYCICPNCGQKSGSCPSGYKSLGSSSDCTTCCDKVDSKSNSKSSSTSSSSSSTGMSDKDANKILNDIYQKCLGRNVDKSGTKTYLQMVKDGKKSKVEKEVCNSKEAKSKKTSTNSQTTTTTKGNMPSSSGLKCGDEVKKVNIYTGPVTEYKCIDSDGGDNPCKKSETKSTEIMNCVPGGFCSYTMSDRCLDETTLLETFCQYNAPGNGRHIGSKKYSCPNGCKSGRCV